MRKYTLSGAMLGILAVSAISCGQSGSQLSSLVPLEGGSNEFVTLYFDGDPESFSIRDLAVGLALLLNPDAELPDIQQVGSDIFGIELTDDDVQQGSNPLARFDLNGDGMSGTIQDFFLAVVVVLGARTIPEAEQMCEELSGSPCDIQPGTALPGVMGATPFPDLTPGSSPTPAPGMLSNVVNTSADDDPMGSNVATCTLREAINALNATEDGNIFGGCQITDGTIQFANSLLEETITIQDAPLPVIKVDATIQGLAPNQPIISGNKQFRIFQIIGEDISVTVDRLTISQGQVSDATAPGAGILVSPNVVLTVKDSTITGNTTRGRGGGINASTAVIINSTLSDNSGGLGGGISAGTLTISNSTVSGNSASNDGGGILAGYKATVTDSTLTGNSAARGGGIDGSGLIVSDSTISDNTANSGGGIHTLDPITVSNSILSGNVAKVGGGGIFSYKALTLSDSTLSNNVSQGATSGGGGIETRGEVTVTNSTLSGNTGQGGGGIAGIAEGLISVINSTLTGNSAVRGGGIATDTVMIANSIISNNSAKSGGGGIDALTATVTNSTIHGNSASAEGGGISVSTATVTNSTISGNSASFGGGIGGGISDTITVINSTITLNRAANRGGGITDGFINLLNTIVAGNTLEGGEVLSEGSDDFSGGSIQGSNNLIGLIGSGGSTDLMDGIDGNIIGVTDITTVLNPVLDTNNTLIQAGDPNTTVPDGFGPVKTHALIPGSPAINAGSNALAVDAEGSPLATDQRGLTRIVGGTVDMGSFEAQ